MYKKNSEIGEKTRELGEKVGDYTEQAAEKVGKQMDTFSNLTKKYSKLIENYAHRYPFKTLVFSVLIGAALAIFMRGLTKPASSTN